ncbi:MAG: NAD-dependent epimerase/dehydratase family protein [Acidobacteriaceae bacterium]
MITGATGMVGEGVMLACLDDPAVEQVLLVSRRTSGARHAKLRECLVPDFLKVEGVAEQLTACDACFFCAGVSSVGRSEAEYTRITYDTTLHFAEVVARLNPGMVFAYVSGMGTDSNEQGRIMWARVKGRTENALTRVGLRAVYNFRPGLMQAMRGQRHLPRMYKAIGWVVPLLRPLLPNYACTLDEVGRAMVQSVVAGYPKTVIDVRDIRRLARTGRRGERASRS